ncbi:MAG: hypothetical protein WAV20_12780, partial [Blastocatellia bacterium]
PDGGFFRGAEVQPGVVGLTPIQHLLTFGLIFTFDHYQSTILSPLVGEPVILETQTSPEKVLVVSHIPTRTFARILGVL